jgi:hypothetical protein
MSKDSPKDIETVAYVLDKAQADFELQDIVLDEVREDEFLIEMKWSGICHTVCVPSIKLYTHAHIDDRT